MKREIQLSTILDTVELVDTEFNLEIKLNLYRNISVKFELRLDDLDKLIQGLQKSREDLAQNIERFRGEEKLFTDEEIASLKKGEKIKAIKSVVERLKFGIKDAKDYVEANWKQLL